MMAGSLDELVLFLIDAIALSGQQGSTPADVLAFISHFYESLNGDATNPVDEPGQARRLNRPIIDRAFQEQVWRWLAKHPDVHVGKDREGNKMSLSALEAQYLNKEAAATLETARHSSTSSSLLGRHGQEPQMPPDSSPFSYATVTNALRVYVSEERAWFAICGHSKDSAKVFDTEFVLLSIIAAHREAGILQGDLVKQSGQDKRSVPKRTDLLRSKGYIEKRIVQLKGLKTSRLILRRFASNGINDMVTPVSVPVGPHGKVHNESVDFNVLIQRLFALLKKKQIMTRDDLKNELEMKNKWRARVLAKVVRKFEVVGCLKRVKAASEASKKARYYFYCVKLIHEPSEGDMDAFYSSDAILNAEHAVEEPDLDDEDDADKDKAMVEQSLGIDGNELEEVDRIVPQWNPDRSLANVLLNLVERAGTQGLANRELRQLVTGTLVRRPLEQLLMRLTTLQLQSQPPHLHHLVMVRDTILSGTIPLYVQYSLPNFEARVKSGQAFWEAVETPAIDSENRGKKTSSNHALISLNVPELDEFGFPAKYAPSSQYKGARTTLGQGLLAARPDNLPFSNRDPTVCDNDSFGYKIKYNAAEASTNSVRPATQDDLAEGDSSTPSGEKSTIKHPSRPVQARLRPKGRPRKFLKGTEKFWQGQFAMARTLANEDQHRILDSKAGAMSDPAGLSLFAKRPPQFDVTLVRALESGLPVPAKPKDITQEWVDRMSPILNRTVPSVHVTPEGVRLQGSGKHAGVSRFLILRSSRLGNLQFSERREVPAVRFLVSSAAHTFVDHKCEVFVETVDDDKDDFYAPSCSTRAQHAPRDLEVVTRGKQNGPRDPICRTPRETQCDRTSGEKEAGTTALSPGTKRRGRPRKLVKISTSGTVSSRKRNSASKRQESASILAAPIDPLGLPPPAMTRSALRKRQRAIHGTSFDEELNRAVSPAIGKQRNDPAERLVENISSQSGPKSSSHLDKVSILEAHERAKTPPEKQFTPAVARTQSGLGSTATESGAGRDILGITGPAPRQLESSLPSSRSPLVRLRTTAPLWTAGSEDEYMVETSQGPLDPLNTDDRDSEAFRLVQELMANGTEQAQEVEGATLTDRNEQRVPAVASSDANEDVNLPKLTVSDEHSDPEASCKRSKDDVVGAGSVAILRRKIVLDLMEACSGALPYYSNSLWSPFTTAWQKAGQSGKPDMRTIKAAVKSLCQNGSAKQIRFSHRNKRGVMVTKTILAKADIAASNEIILEIQKRMMETDPHPYLPEALEVDSELKRDMGRQRSTPWPAVIEEQTVQSSVTPAKVLRLQLRETLSCARRKRRSTDLAAEGVNKERDSQSDMMVPRPRLGGTRRKYTRRSEPYPRPKLSMDHHPRPPQLQLSDKSPASPNPLDFQTESSPVPSIFDASAAPKTRAPKSQAPITPHSSKHAKATSQLHFISDTPNLRPLQPVSIIWTKTGDQPVLPSSLEDILSDDHRRSKADDAKWGDPATRDFEWTVDGVASWEQRSPNLFDFKSTDWVFINHSVGDTFKAAPGVGSRIRFDGLIWYDQRGRGHTEKRFHAYEESIDAALVKERRAILRRERQKVARQTQSELIAAQPLSKRKRVSVDPAEATKKRRRGKSPLTQPQTITDSAGNLIDVSHLIGAKYRRPRGIQHLRTMPEHLIYKLAVTVVVVRALAGGLEKHIDWPLVMSVFPSDDEQFLKDRWKTLSNKHRRDIDQLFENFQDRFPGAYAQGEVQHINFDDLESVDWESLVQWALNNLDKRIMHDIPELPPSRSELDETVSLRIERNHRPYRELFGYNQAVTVPMKEAAISAIPFAVPLPLASPASHPDPPHPLDPTADNCDPALTLAKSWALSTITTPLLTFDAAKAQSKLQSLAPVASESETLIESAMKSLSSTKVVSKKRDKSTDAKGRSYDLSRVFTDTLDQRRSINATMLKQAARYKTAVLDAAFAKCEVAEFQPVSVEDGDMVAILNLSAHGRIKIKIGPDVPRNRWGIDEDSRYQTRNIKKESLYFTVLMQQIPGKYVLGNPLLKQDVRMPDLGNGDRDLIPIWRDIHGGFQRGSWDLALAAVLGILASRPGADVREVAQTMRPALQVWEVESLLAWCLEVGAVQRTGQDDESGWTGGWEVREWWWMVLECGML